MFTKPSSNVWRMAAGLLIVTTAPVQAHNGGTKPSTNEGPKRPVIQLEQQSMGKTITIGPDGKMETSEWGGKDFELPPVIRKHLQQSMTDAMKNMGRHRNLASGSITILGADGKVQTRSFNDGQFSPEVIAEIIGKSLGTNKMTDEVKQKLKNSLGTLPDRMKNTVPLQTQFARKSELDALSTKLDKILERLKKIEKVLEEKE